MPLEDLKAHGVALEGLLQRAKGAGPFGVDFLGFECYTREEDRAFRSPYPLSEWG